MTIVTIEINKEQELSALKDYLSKNGLSFEVEEVDNTVYSDEFKAMLNERYQDYAEGKVSLIDHDEVQKQMEQLLASGKKNV